MRSIVLLSCLLASFSVRSQSQSVAIESKVNLRDGPSKSAHSLRTLSAKDTVEAVAADTLQSGFIHVRTQSGKSGWVAIPFAHRIRPAISAERMALEVYESLWNVRSVWTCTSRSMITGDVRRSPRGAASALRPLPKSRPLVGKSLGQEARDRTRPTRLHAFDLAQRASLFQ